MEQHLINLVAELRATVQKRFHDGMPDPLGEFGISGHWIRDELFRHGTYNALIQTLGAIFRLSDKDFGEWRNKTRYHEYMPGA